MVFDVEISSMYLRSIAKDLIDEISDYFHYRYHNFHFWGNEMTILCTIYSDELICLLSILEQFAKIIL